MAKMKALEDLFVKGLPDRMREISDAVDVCVAQPSEASTVAILHRYLHSLAGTAGTFGFQELGERARALEIDLEPALNGGVDAERVIADMQPHLQNYLDWAKTI